MSNRCGAPDNNSWRRVARIGTLVRLGNVPPVVNEKHLPHVSTSIHNCSLRSRSRHARPRRDDFCGLASDAASRRHATPAFFGTLLGRTTHIGAKVQTPRRGEVAGRSSSELWGDRAQPLLTYRVTLTNYMRVVYVTGATRAHGNKRVTFGHDHSC